MKLSELEPKFIRYETRIESRNFATGDQATWAERGWPSEPRTVPVPYRITVETFAEAQGLDFLCPKCFAQNKGAVGTHGCDVTFDGRGAAADQGSHNDEGKPTRWNASGSDFGNLTLTPSIKLNGGCAWHGHITNGEIRG